MKFKTPLYLVPRTSEFLRVLLSMRNQRVLSTREHLQLCAEWLLHSQNVIEEGGYVASYSLVTGLRCAYIETTGYIIPTMFDLAVRLSDVRCRESASRAGEWLLSVQQADGSFTDIDHFQAQVFDTGQVMLGLQRIYLETKDERFLEAVSRASAWLVSAQDADGSWTTAGYYRGM